jgi:hypothetical protein
MWFQVLVLATATAIFAAEVADAVLTKPTFLPLMAPGVKVRHRPAPRWWAASVPAQHWQHWQD